MMIDIPTLKIGQRIRWCDIAGNVFDDGRQFCATSFDEKWCCVGVIINPFKNYKSKNPMLRINDIYKKAAAKGDGDKTSVTPLKQSEDKPSSPRKSGKELGRGEGK